MGDVSSKNVRIQGWNENTDGSTGLVFNDTYESQALQFTVAGLLQISSSSANDAAAGTGAQSVKISGFDIDGKVIEEVIATNGQTAVPTTNIFDAITDVRVIAAGSGGVNAGNIFVSPSGTALTAGVPQGTTIITLIEIGKGTANQWQLKVPHRHTASLFGSFVGGQSLQYEVQAQRPDEAWNTIAQIFINTEAPIDLPVSGKFPAGTLFRVRYIDGVGGNIITSSLKILLEAVGSTRRLEEANRINQLIDLGF